VAALVGAARIPIAEEKPPALVRPGVFDSWEGSDLQIDVRQRLAAVALVEGQRGGLASIHPKCPSKATSSDCCTTSTRSTMPMMPPKRRSRSLIGVLNRFFDLPELRRQCTQSSSAVLPRLQESDWGIKSEAAPIVASVRRHWELFAWVETLAFEVH
jgi:hypothetical protein